MFEKTFMTLNKHHQKFKTLTWWQLNKYFIKKYEFRIKFKDIVKKFKKIDLETLKNTYWKI